MRLIRSLAPALLACTGVVIAPFAGLIAYAQPVVDDDDADDAVDDDDDVPDPDDVSGPAPDVDDGADDTLDSPDDDAGGTDDTAPGSDDAGADDAGVGDDGAGDDAGGSDDAAAGAGDDAEDSDDADDAAGGTAGANNDDDDDDDAAGTADDDDDDDAAGGTAGSTNDDDDDDDDDANGDDDDDDGPMRPAAGADDDDDDDDATDERLSYDLDDDDDDDDEGQVQFIGAGEEPERQRAALDREQGIGTDREGFRYRRHEFVAADLDAKEQAALRTKGFTILQSERLVGTGGTIHLIKGPARLSDADALSAIDDLTDPSSLSFNHLFDSSSGEVQKVKGKAVPARPACGCQIGMIDTGVAAKLPLFRHVTVEQRAFNGTVPAPGNHGTAVAHRFAGTTPLKGRPTRIVAADIFSGPRASAGSTFALVKALDWMASRNVAVINVSLAGPRNAVVASTVERLVKKGHAIVAAAGNDGPAAPPVFPGAYTGVIAVTAVDTTQKVYRYANRGKYVDFSAVGVRVETISPKGEVTAATGTSFAAPVVATRLARELTRPDPAAVARTVTRLEKEARDLGEPGRDTVFGHGLVEEPR